MGNVFVVLCAPVRIRVVCPLVSGSKTGETAVDRWLEHFKKQK